MLEMGMKKKDRRNKRTVDEIAATIMLQEYMQITESKKIKKDNLNLPYNNYLNSWIISGPTIKFMILPIVAYGNPVLRKVGKDITPDYPGLHQLIEDMWETMYNSRGVGLAAPQVNKDIRLFIMDSVQIIENLEEMKKILTPVIRAIKVSLSMPK